MSSPEDTEAGRPFAREREDDPPAVPERPAWRKKRYLLPALLVVTMVVIGLMFGDPSPPRVAGGAPAEEAEDLARCQEADPFVLTAISEGLIDAEEASIPRARAVESRDFESLWFVATELDAPDVESGTTMVWAVDRNDPRLTTVFAVDETADELSLWGDVVIPENPPTMSDDGAQLAVACLEAGAGS